MSTKHFETTTLAELTKRGLVERSQLQEMVAESALVLVVDDERVIADTLALILNSSGFTAEAAYSAEDALTRATANPPDILISDVVMPGMNGIELANRVRVSWPECKILLFSGSASISEWQTKAESEGHQFDLVSKPLHPRELLDLLAAWGFCGKPHRIAA